MGYFVKATQERRPFLCTKTQALLDSIQLCPKLHGTQGACSFLTLNTSLIWEEQTFSVLMNRHCVEILQYYKRNGAKNLLFSDIYTKSP